MDIDKWASDLDLQTFSRAKPRLANVLLINRYPHAALSKHQIF